MNTGSTLYYYPFHNNDRMSNDTIDNTTQTITNSQSLKYMLSSYHESGSSTQNYVNFATEQPSVIFSGIAHGSGLNGHVIDAESNLTIKNKMDRPLEKIQLIQRPFATVPYLGKGGFNPYIESQLQQGEIVSDKKSVSTIMEKSFLTYSMFPENEKMSERVNNPAFNVEESALEGWVRGGLSTREMKS